MRRVGLKQPFDVEDRIVIARCGQQGDRRKREAEAELEQVRTMRQDTPQTSEDDGPPYLSGLFQGSLFQIRGK